MTRQWVKTGFDSSVTREGGEETQIQERREPNDSSDIHFMPIGEDLIDPKKYQISTGRYTQNTLV